MRRLDYINLPKHLCQWLIGKEHHTHHRLMAGGAIMIVGVVVAECGGMIELIVVKMVVQLAGFSLHGLGLVPFLEWLMAAKE